MSGQAQAPLGRDETVLGTALAVAVLAGCALLDVVLAAHAGSLAATAQLSPISPAPATLIPTLVHDGLPGVGVSTMGGRVVFFAVLGLLMLAELGGGVWAAIRVGDWLRGRHDASRLAGRRDLGDLAGRQAAAKARQLRPSLRSVSGDLDVDVGIRLMQIAGRDVVMSWEDVALVLMGPRSNKTSAIAIPTILCARGPVVATSNKADVWSLTAALRGAVGEVFVFDPQQIAFVQQDWYCDPIAWIRSTHQDRQFEAAARLAEHFASTVTGQQSDPFFTNAATDSIISVMLAAAATPQGTMRDVLRWLAARYRDAVRALDDAGRSEDAEDFEAMTGGAEVTAKGILQTARTAMKCLRSESLMRWVTPPHTWATPPEPGQHIREFDPWTLFAEDGYPTLYLLSKEGGASSAPVVTMLVDRVTEVAEFTAQARGGRLDPSLTLLLDEAANICPLAGLPAQYSHWGSRGIQSIAILQSYKQGAKVWGREGMDALWSAATAKVCGAGLEDVDFLNWLSSEVGDHWVPKPASTSRDHRGGGSTSHDVIQQPIMPVSRLRQLPKTEALLITPGRPIGHGRLLPWYSEHDDADEISTAGEDAAEEVRAAAVAYLGPNNPVARALSAGRDDASPQLADPL